MRWWPKPGPLVSPVCKLMLGIRAVYRRCIVFIGRRVLLICYIIFHNITLSVLNTVCTGRVLQTGWLVTFPLCTGVCLSVAESGKQAAPLPVAEVGRAALANRVLLCS